MSKQNYNSLIDYNSRTMALAEVAGLLSWDQETMMPRKGAAQRAEQSGAIQTIIHERYTDTKVADWLAAIDDKDLSAQQQRDVELIRRAHNRAVKIPVDLATEIARLASEAQGIWAAARAANQYSDFAPVLEKTIELRRQEAACLSNGSKCPYDALLDDYEAGMTTEVLTPLFDRLRGPLTDLRQEIADAGRAPAKVTGHFAKEAQLALGHKLAATFGYDGDAGRLDMSVHPFSSGSGADVRITTRIDETEPFGAIYSVIHETGHAVYEQNIASDLRLKPTGAYCSMGIHESQSRMFENQMGRSRAFMEWLYPEMRDAFGDIGVTSPEELYAAVNNVETGYIRTEADEVHYNLHVILRYNLERDLINGDLDVKDLEGEWNRRFEADFGLAVPDAARGVLQDVHWSVGLFGYFPTYSLGNIYAADLYTGIQADCPNLEQDVAAAQLAKPIGWLTDKVHKHGNTYAPATLIENAVGQKPTEAALIKYLRGKFLPLYS